MLLMRRAAEAEDGLVVVAHHRDVAMPGGQQLDQLELRVVGVLELVHEDVAIAPLVAPQDVRARAEEAQRLDDLVAEVDLARAGPSASGTARRCAPARGAARPRARVSSSAARGQQPLGVGQVLVRARRPRP